MSQFVLKSSESAGMTSISNYFLDYYMPRANGEYVKVYLYLLRALNRPDLTLSVAGLADALDRTESDILRALKYWEKQGLLKLECNASNVLLGGITLQLTNCWSARQTCLCRHPRFFSCRSFCCFCICRTGT